MALLDTMKTEFPHSSQELEEIDLLRTDGRRHKFHAKDGKEDCINGVFQLRTSKAIAADYPMFCFEEFRATQEKRPNGSMWSTIKQINNNFAKLEFRKNKKGFGIAFCPDTRNNRNLLADVFFEKRCIIEGLLTENGAIGATEIKKEIETLALLRKAARQKNNNADSTIVDRLINNLTPEQREMFAKKFVAAENKAKAPLAVPESKPVIEAKSDSIQPVTVTESANTVSIAESVPSVKIDIPDVPKPEGGLKYFALKSEAKKAILTDAKNSLYIEALKKEFGNKWNSCSKYKAVIQPQIVALLDRWTKAVTV